MWKLELHTKKEENDFFDCVFCAIKSKIDPSLDINLVKLASNKKLMKRIILAKPQEMKRINNIFNGRYKKYIGSPDIQKIINYTEFIKKRHHSGLATKLAKLKNVRTCPYCNRAFTETITRKWGNYTLRADFDHFLNQSTYPIFALSLYNLVPSCQNCNRTIKHSKNFKIETHLHPYIDNNERTNWEFDYRLLRLDGYLLTISNHSTDTKVQQTLDDLKLEEIYSLSHSDYELKDLLELNKKYPSGYIQQLIHTIMKDTGLTKQEAILHTFGVQSDDDKDLHRVLNKMRKDIMKDLLS